MPPMTVFEDDFWKQFSHEFTDKRIYDRTHTLNLPYEQVDISPIPPYVHTTDTLSEVSLRVAEDITRMYGRWNLSVLWSGGIDSTNIVASFLKLGVPICVIHSKESVEEFPEFYNDVVSKLQTEVFTDFRDMLIHQSEKPITLIGGEFGDYCTREVGIANKKGWVNGTGFIWNMDEGIPPHRKEFLQPVFDACPFELEDIEDEFWW